MIGGGLVATVLSAVFRAESRRSWWSNPSDTEDADGRAERWVKGGWHRIASGRGLEQQR